MGEANNQNFAGIPFYRFINMLAYLCERNGIGFIRQEESYTSMASFMDNDDIPVYGGESGAPAFSGKRIARGLYRSADGTVINADVNGSLNIIRKRFPDAFKFKGMAGFDRLSVSEVWNFNKFYGNIKVKVS